MYDWIDTILMRFLDMVIGIKMHIEVYIKRFLQYNSSGFYWNSFYIYKIDSETGEQIEHPENDALKKYYSNKNTYNLGPFNCLRMFSPPKQFSNLNRMFAQDFLNLDNMKDLTGYYIDVSYNYKNKEYYVIYKDKVQFPPYVETDLNEKLTHKMRRRYTRSYFKDDSDMISDDFQNIVSGYSGPLGNFYQDIHLQNVYIHQASMKTSGLYFKLMQYGKKYESINIKDNRGNVMEISADDPFCLPPRSFPRLN